MARGARPERVSWAMTAADHRHVFGLAANDEGLGEGEGGEGDTDDEVCRTEFVARSPPEKDRFTLAAGAEEGAGSMASSRGPNSQNWIPRLVRSQGDRPRHPLGRRRSRKSRVRSSCNRARSPFGTCVRQPISSTLEKLRALSKIYERSRKFTSTLENISSTLEKISKTLENLRELSKNYESARKNIESARKLFESARHFLRVLVNFRECSKKG